MMQIDDMITLNRCAGLGKNIKIKDSMSQHNNQLFTGRKVQSLITQSPI